jgi:hypothetical protein
MPGATRDGFTAEAFHLKCDGKENTITIIKNNLNFVFGGYLFEGITSSNGWGVDSRAFIFSLRRLGVTNCLKFMVTDANHAIYGHSGLGPTFGQGIDICIKDNSNINTGSYTNFSCSYESPREFLSKGQHSKLFLQENLING